MDKKAVRSIREKLLSIVLLPIIVLSILITMIGVTLFYRFYTKSIRDELKATTNTMLDYLNIMVEGEYEYKDGVLMKGDLNITESTMLCQIKKQSQIDLTVFWEDTRILTTIEDAQGVSAVGTKSDSDVANMVLHVGRDYFPDNLVINGMKYIGYYAPLENGNHEIVGMMFSGKQKNLVYQKIIEVVLWFAVFSFAVVGFSVWITRKFSSHMIEDINSINQFLKTISEGNLRTALDERVVQRTDELGSIGMYASKMRRNLQKLIETDSLTGLYNRRSCHSMLEAIVQNGENYCVIMCDIDLFKKINDCYGHDAGDYVLVETSNLIRQNVQDVGFASRWGGEEFLLVYKLDFEQTKERAAKLQQSIREHEFCYQGTSIQVTLTFGVAKGASHKDYEQVITQADQRLYIGKNNGRNQIVF